MQEITSFYACVPKIGTVPEIQSETENFLSFWAILWLFTPLNSLKNQNFKKMKKAAGDIIILHMCTKNDDQMMYGS